jgi:hypothetical protein
MNTNKLILFIIFSGCLFLTTCKKVEKEILVTTGIVTNILTTSADVSGEIIDLGEGVTQHGHCYAKTPNTSVAGSKTEIGIPVGVGGFTSSLTGLEPGTKYYIKAYCSRGKITVYGSEINFTTASAALPDLTTAAVTSITKTSAAGGGNVTSQGGTPVTARGVCWNVATLPVITDNKTINGTGTGTFTSTLSGLTAGTRYYVRAYATNAGGTAYGDEVNFTTTSDTPVPPTVTTAGVSSVTSSSAVCGGEVTNEGSASVTAKGVCWSTSANPTILNFKTADGSGLGSFISNLTGLSPGITYYIRAYATNSAGTSYGTESFFSTSAVKATLTTLPVTSVTSITASSGGDITNTGGATITVKGVCWSLSASPTINDFKTTDGTATIPSTYNSSLENLLPGTDYYVRAYATNSAGTAYGNQLTFTTLLSPIASTGTASSVTTNTVTLNGMVNANGQSTTVTFEYGLTAGYGSSVNATPSPVTGSNITGVSAALTGLDAGTTYHFRVKAVSLGGTSFGTDQTCTTLCSSPSIITNSASNIGSGSANLNGTVNANNFSTSVTFEYGLSLSYGSSVTASTNPLTGNTNTAVSAIAVGLAPNTLYHFRVKAVNCGGIIYGGDLTFTTLCTAPSATTTSATVVGTNLATLNGIVNANNFLTSITFEYGTTTSYGSSVSASPGSVTGTSNTSVNAGITGLSPNTLYHFRIKTSSCGGNVDGNDLTFTTLCAAPSAVTNVPTNVSSSSSTINGSVNANNSSTSVTFEYGTTLSYGTSVSATPSLVTGITSTVVNAGISGLLSNSTYHYLVKATNCGGNISGSDMTFITLPLVTTTPISGITTNSATGGGSIVIGGGENIIARGICWSSLPGPTILNNKTIDGSGTGSYPSSITGLGSWTTYYVRAYATNSTGTAYGNETSFVTPRTITHTAVGVVPLNKTITYGIVLTNLSGTSKYWITQNLGADNQASSVTDATEAAAGWYWQFNTRQGYKHDGTTRTPSTTWITSINENSNWTIGNDVCFLLLGTNWRIPTMTEWMNADNNGGWNNASEAFASVLKLHAAGGLTNTGGSRSGVGTYGNYWSTVQYSNTEGYYLNLFTGGASYVGNLWKPYGFSIRCIKD